MSGVWCVAMTGLRTKKSVQLPFIAGKDEAELMQGKAGGRPGCTHERRRRWRCAAAAASWRATPTSARGSPQRGARNPAQTACRLRTTRGLSPHSHPQDVSTSAIPASRCKCESRPAASDLLSLSTISSSLLDKAPGCGFAERGGCAHGHTCRDACPESPVWCAFGPPSLLRSSAAPALPEGRVSHQGTGRRPRGTTA